MSSYRRPSGSGHIPSRSVRIPDSVWDPANLRAAREDVTMSYVINALCALYAQGILDLPQVQLVYPINASGPHRAEREARGA